MELWKILADYLLENQILFSKEEAEIIAEVVLEDHAEYDDWNKNEQAVSIIENLIEYLDVEEDQAENIFQCLQWRYNRIKIDANNESPGNDEEVESSEEESERSSTFESNYIATIKELDDWSMDTNEKLIDGECELCDRYIKLTKHHLIPKSTWPKIKNKLLHAVDAKEKGDAEEARLIVGPGLEDVLDRMMHSVGDKKSKIRAILHGTTCNICRQCHSTVHRAQTNMDLALNYNTVEKLLEDAQVARFCKWVSKQKTGKYS